MPLSRRVLLLAPLLAPALTRSAAAHAVAMASEPAAGAALAAPPTEVVVRFNSRVDPIRSRLTLFGPGNVQVPLSLADEGTSPALLRAAVPAEPPLAPGAWRLRWQVLALDGHITRGDIPFTLRGR